MTINSTTRKAGPFVGTGIQTAYPFAFKVFTASDMLVVQTNTLGVDATLALGTDYAVALNADQNANPGGTVNMTVAPPTGFMLTLGSVVPATQGQSIPNNGGFFPKVIEDAFDKLTIEVQQLAEKIGRTLQYAFSDTASGGTMPPAASRANNLLGFDASGNIIAVAPTAGSATALQALLATPAGAGLIGNNPAGNIAATTVQAALNELDSEKVSLAGVENITGLKTFTVSPIVPDVSAGDSSGKAVNSKYVAAAIAAAVPKGHLNGCSLVPAGGTVNMTVLPGMAADSTAAVLIALASSIVKTTAAWAVGSGNGALDEGVIAAGTRYYFFLIRRPDTAVVDVLASQSHGASSTATISIAAPAVVSWAAHGLEVGAGIVFQTTGALPTGLVAGTRYYVIASGYTNDSFQVSAAKGGAAITTTGAQSGVHTVSAPPVLPANYTQLRYLGGNFTNGSSQWTKVTQRGNVFTYGTPVRDLNASGTATAVLLACSIPKGRPMQLLANGYVNNGANGIYLSDPTNDDLAPDIGAAVPLSSLQAGASSLSGPMSCWTDAAGRIRHREVNTGIVAMVTLGWVDNRDRI